MLCRFLPALLANWIIRGLQLRFLNPVAIMRVMDLIRMLLFPIFIVATAPWHFYVLTFVTYLCSAVAKPCSLSVVKLCCESDDLASANNLLGAGQNLLMLIGPLIGGILYASRGAAFVLVLNSATFLVSFLILLRVKVAHSGPANSAEEAWGRHGLYRDVLRLARSYPQIVLFIVVDAVSGFAFGALNTLIPAGVQLRFHNSAFIYSALLSSLTGGMLIGNMVFQRWFIRFKLLRVYLVATSVALVFFLLSGLATMAALAAVFLAIVGLCNSMQDVVLATSVQAAVEDIRGLTTVFAISESLAAVSVVVSSALLAVLLQKVSVTTLTILVFALATGGCVVYCLLHRRALAT